MNLQEKTCAVAILARDCEEALKRNIPLVERIGGFFRDYSVFVIENDSKDGTAGLLSEWSRVNPKVIVDSKDLNGLSAERTGSTSSRIERMVMLRNKYLDYYRSCGKEYDFLMIIDIDLDIIIPENIKKALEDAPGDFAGLTANGRFYSKVGKKILWGKYYDNYAFLLYNSEHIDLTYEEVRRNNDMINRETSRNSYVKCDSAFAGVGIYKFDEAMRSRYRTGNNERSQYYSNVCEHVFFNRDMNQFGQIYIASGMKLGYKKQSLLELAVKAPVKQSQMLWVYRNLLRRKIPV